MTPATDHAALLASPDARLAQNKRLVYDFWREVFEAGHLELAEKYMAEGYVQHNPNVPTGRAAFVEFFGRFKKPGAIQAQVAAPLVSITAEGNLVVLGFVRELPDPKEPGRKYTTTWFDMFRIEGGKIAEHWDAAEKQAPRPASAADASAEEEVKAVTQRACDAFQRADAAAVEELLAPGFTLVGSDGSVQPLSQALAEVHAKEPKYEVFRNHDMVAHVYGDAATVQGITTLKGSSGGKPFALDMRFTDTLVRMNGKWRIVVSHVTRIPAP
ncbi:MAG TPA: nuclear transport factor 2 family protein [Ideonella sp.]|nr:nuclear transport factor 2 family protein [Ideonella sp.]